ncbi:hypothetical protein HUU05_14750 [candidate division KSB1 bacterium]|nr:hypothetical protein [candidate division KSB1 bacterium]
MKRISPGASNGGDTLIKAGTKFAFAAHFYFGKLMPGVYLGLPLDYQGLDSIFGLRVGLRLEGANTSSHLERSLA